ncbi:MAG: uroporphyrinogen decarboxylase family protein [Mesotoga sp.]|nr:uroporphyrinogen decarboxylase family protein [Mesotoga sp.]
MTSRERIIEALNHREADRVPVDLGGMRSTGIHAMAYRRLKEYMGLPDRPVKIFDVFQQLALVEEEVRRRVHSDVVELKRLDGGFNTRIDKWKEYDMFEDGGRYLLPDGFDSVTMPDGSRAIVREGRIVAIMPKGGFYFDGKHFPLADTHDRKAIDEAVRPGISDGEIAFLKDQLRELKSSTDCAVMGTFGGNFLEAGHSYFGYQEFMERMVTDRPLVEYFLDRLLEKYTIELERYLFEVGGDIDLIQIGDDYGTQENTQISPRIFRSLFKPRLKALCDFIHSKRPGLFIFLHSCGSVYPFIGDFIEAGVQVLNPVQTNAKNMDPAILKREFGGEIVLWGGGCDTQHLLLFGTLEEIEEDVRRRIDILAPGGGFVFASIHNIQMEIPPEKILRLFDTAYEYGRGAYSDRKR